MSDLLARLGVEIPILQAGMGGGLSSHALAAAVSEAGGLGTIGILDPAGLREELAAARRLTDKPLAVNLLVPFAGRGHWEAASEADAVVTHWQARPRRRTPKVWIHTVGSAPEARAAADAGADAVIAQGVESGGHVRGAVPALELLTRVRAAVPYDYPVLVAVALPRPTTPAGLLRTVRSPRSPAPASWPARRAARTPTTSAASSTAPTPCSPSCSGWGGRGRRTA